MKEEKREGERIIIRRKRQTSLVEANTPTGNLITVSAFFIIILSKVFNDDHDAILRILLIGIISHDSDTRAKPGIPACIYIK